MTDDDIVTIFYPILEPSLNERLIAISIGRAIEQRVLADAGRICDAVSADSKNHLFRSGAKICALGIRALGRGER